MASYEIIWRFEVPAQHRAAFEQAYGPRGAWAELFGKAQGFIEVRLLRATEEEGIYFTVDRWASEAAFIAFREKFGSEYAALDAQLEGLASAETRIGSFAAVL